MPWYAVHTRSRHEDTVYKGLILKSINTFLPKMEVWSKRKDRRKRILIPVFPGYLFVELKPSGESSVPGEGLNRISPLTLQSAAADGNALAAGFIPDNQARLNVLTTPGVVRILGKRNGGEPLPVPDSQIESIQRLVESKIEMQRIQYPGIGDKAQIIDGPFMGIEGIVLNTDLKKDLFIVSIDILQRSVAIRLEGFQIAKI